MIGGPSDIIVGRVLRNEGGIGEASGEVVAQARKLGGLFLQAGKVSRIIATMGKRG